MGTSQSKRDAPPSAALIPPWADQDPPPPGAPPPQPGALPPQPGAPPPGAPAAAPQVIPTAPAPPRRYANFRVSLGHYLSSGDQRDARKAIGHWARTSTGGAKAGTARVARAARTGGAALAGVARAAAGQPPIAGALDVRSLAGLPVDAAIDRIVDAFCQPGILDEDTARIAIGEALATALEGADIFDPNTIDINAVRLATLTFAAELVFLSVAGDGGNALAAAPSPAAAIQREADIRALVHEVADIVGTPIIAAAGDVVSPDKMALLVSSLVEAVRKEMETW